MSKITNALNHAMTAISDQNQTIMNKLVMYVGVSGSSVGVASGIAKNTTELSTSFLTLAEWGSTCGILGGLTLAIKSVFDIYFARRKEKRDQELHEIKLKGAK